MSKFEVELNCWLRKNGFVCDVEFDDDFGYDRLTNTLIVGTIDYAEIGVWFDQFLYEYGAEYCGIFSSVLSLLHELGHKMTIGSFSDDELIVYDTFKNLMEDRMENYNMMYLYWEMPDEFAANAWVVDFINGNIDAVEELCNIYISYWNDFVKEMYSDET